jgi:hypothetical protein
MIWKEAVVVPSKDDTCVCVEGLRKAMETLILPYVLVEIRTAHLWNTSHEYCHYANPLSSHGSASSAVELLGAIGILILRFPLIRPKELNSAFFWNYALRNAAAAPLNVISRARTDPFRLICILWCTESLLGKYLETNNETTAVAMQRRSKHASISTEFLLQTVFSTQFVQRGDPVISV